MRHRTMTRVLPLLLLALSLLPGRAAAQGANPRFDTVKITATSDSLCVGVSVGAACSTASGRIYTGTAGAVGGIAIKGGTPSDGGIVIPADTPASTTSNLYSPDGTTLWFGASQLASVSGTTNRLGKFTGATSVGDSSISDDGSTVSTPLPIITTSTSATSLDVGGGINAGSGNVALVGTDGRLNGPLSSAIIDDLSGVNLTGLLEANITDGAILSRLAANETITGAWIFSNATAARFDLGGIVIRGGSATHGNLRVCGDQCANAVDITDVRVPDGGGLEVVVNNGGLLGFDMDTSGNALIAGTWTIGGNLINPSPFDIMVGGSSSMYFYSGGVAVNAGDYLFLDSGSDSYLREKAGNAMQWVAGGQETIVVEPNAVAITGTVGISGLTTLSGTAANIALGSNFLSGDGGDEGITVDSAGAFNLSYLVGPGVNADLFNVTGIGGIALATLKADEGGAATFSIAADQGDDNNDWFSIYSAGGGDVRFRDGSGGNYLSFSGLTSMTLASTMTLTIPGLASSSGTRYVCSDTSGTLVDSTSACSGTDSEAIASIPELWQLIYSLRAEVAGLLRTGPVVVTAVRPGDLIR